jgi:fructose-1,6-bisphosphatase I
MTKSLGNFLQDKKISANLSSLLNHLACVGKYINHSIRNGNTGISNTTNSFGENQLALDLLADKIITEELRKSKLVKLAISEEQSQPITFENSTGNFIVAYDPLDGSSLVDANLSIGTIFGVWQQEDGGLFGQNVDKNMVASCYIIYGPRVILVVAIKDSGVQEFELNDVGEFILTREKITIQATTKYFSPGNLRACNFNEKYGKIVQKMIKDGKTLRYSGGMVPDLHHILCKGEGFFSYPADDKNKQGKLRLLFECGPFAFIFREAGGFACEEKNGDILKIKIEDYHQTTPIFIGSKKAVQETVNTL